MNPAFPELSPYLTTAIAGLLATGAMSGILYLIHWRGIANADMINAVGSIVTKREENALAAGLLVHFGSGVIFAYIYVGAWSIWEFTAPGIYIMFGLLTGLAHGLVVSFVLVALVAEHHPVAKYRQAGLGVALAHLVAHVAYGVVVGLVASFLLLRFDFMPVLAKIVV